MLMTIFLIALLAFVDLCFLFREEKKKKQSLNWWHFFYCLQCFLLLCCWFLFNFIVAEGNFVTFSHCWLEYTIIMVLMSVLVHSQLSFILSSSFSNGSNLFLFHVLSYLRNLFAPIQKEQRTKTKNNNNNVRWVYLCVYNNFLESIVMSS